MSPPIDAGCHRESRAGIADGILIVDTREATVAQQIAVRHVVGGVVPAHDRQIPLRFERALVLPPEFERCYTQRVGPSGTRVSIEV